MQNLRCRYTQNDIYATLLNRSEFVKLPFFEKNKGNIKREYSKNDKKTKTYITHSVRNNPNNTSLKKGNIETTKDTLKVGVIAELFGNNPKNIPLIPFLKRNFIL